MKRLSLTATAALRTTATMAAALLVAGGAHAQSAGSSSMDQRIAQAVLPLPEALRADATVYTYDENGERQVLREGTNHVECRPRDEQGFTWCYPTSTRARRDLGAKLRAQGKSGEEYQAAMAAAERAGEIQPTPFGSMMYRHYANDDRIQLLWVPVLPGATAEQLGMSTTSQRDNALAGQGLPWMMREGTPGAHLMIPINGRPESNAGGAVSRLDTKSITDPVQQAVLPLPEDLRDGATVVTYENGQRTVLRQGTNMIECQPRDEATGFTRCYHGSLAAQQNLVQKLQAEGKSGEEIQAAVAAAEKAGEIEPVPVGSLAYRLYEDDDRIRLLWVLRVPGATAEELGMPTASQRDDSLAGKGLPWMMREGTPSAHLMIPINGSELSNKP